MPVDALNPDRLYQECDPAQLTFETTDDLEPVDEIVGQPRAVEAVRFGVEIRREGYNIFALGEPGTGKRTLVEQFLRRRAPSEATPDDWVYVNNFEESHRPVAIALPCGRAKEFRDDMDHFIDDARAALSNAFESEEYRERHRGLQEEFSQKQEQQLDELQERAKEKGLTMMRTPQGIGLAPMGSNGRPMNPEVLQEMPDDRRKQLAENAQELESEMQRIVEQAPVAHREARRQLKELNEEFADTTLESLANDLRAKYADFPRIQEHLDAVTKDLRENTEELLNLMRAEQDGQQPQQAANGFPIPVPPSVAEQALLRRYRVNIFVAHEPDSGAPVILENNPTYLNLIGRIDHQAQMGALYADFHNVKPGALQRANGGYLIVEILKVLMQPYAWDVLKRSLQAQEACIESIGHAYGLISTVTVQPQPIPLDLKVVLLGPPQLFLMLRELDPDMPELFKVPADFQEEMQREGNCELYARLLATIVRKEKLRPFRRDAVARIIERSARLAGDAQKLSVHMRSVADLLREADYWSRRDGDGLVTADDVERAVNAQLHRTDRYHRRMQEEIQRGTILIDTEGAAPGQINALSVMRFGDHWFGRPTRVTARVRMGHGAVIDIEREVKLGGALHSKGVLILTGFLTGRYAADVPLSLSASIVFEQSYGGIEGDSASAAELFALLSAIADTPLKQTLAVTGSVNQHGQIQAIGGVNDKIEGFFDICQARGLTGPQGVLIPQSNVQHLMLRRDVIDAVREGKFHVWPMRTVDEGLEVLTGVPVGERDAQGHYPEDSFNGRIASRLRAMAEKRKKFAPPPARPDEAPTGPGGEE